jgi:hypothetical protein
MLLRFAQDDRDDREDHAGTLAAERCREEWRGAGGAEFLFSPNRLNVAVSRAEALAIMVGSPELWCGPEQLI